MPLPPSCRLEHRSFIRRIQYRPDGLLWLIPHREMTAMFEPLDHCIGEGRICARRLLRQAQPILAPPADYDRGVRVCRTLLIWAVGEIAYKRAEGARARE